MKQILRTIALSTAIVALPAQANAKAPIEGQWKNPKGSVVVRVAACGDAFCGTVVEATAKARATARDGGTSSLIGTRILSGVRHQGDGTYRGHAFDPKRNIHAPATIRMQGGGTLVIKGCVLGGIICKEQRWTRIG